MKKLTKRMSFKIGVTIILIEIVVFTSLGFYYIKRFSTEIEDRVISQIGIPGKLMTRGLLSYDSVGDKEVMDQLVGEELLEGLVIGMNKKVYWSLNSSYSGKKITEVKHIEFPNLLFQNVIENKEITTSQKIGDYLVNITRLCLNDGKLIGFLYIKAGTSFIKREQKIITAIFILGSIICVILTSIVIIFSFHLIISKKIKALTFFIRGVEAGDLTSRVEEPIYNDEIGILQMGVNSMVIRLQDTFNKLEKRLTELKKAEERIKGSLREKEVLLKEIHHRVKNNMQVISSLLNLQSEHIKEKRAFEMFRDSKDRVRSMALVHEKLYQSQDLARIDFTEYINGLVKGLYQSYGIDSKRIEFKIKAEEIFLSINLAVPCGLIINEIVSNSIKHAFPASWKGKGRIEISFTIRDEEMELTVSDNGIGLHKDISFRNTDSLGLHLVTILAEDQLCGKITLDRRWGTKFKIKFENSEVRDEKLEIKN